MGHHGRLPARCCPLLSFESVIAEGAFQAERGDGRSRQEALPNALLEERQTSNDQHRCVKKRIYEVVLSNRPLSTPSRPLRLSQSAR